MTVFTEGRHAAEFLLSEGQGNFSRDNITVASSQDFKAGQVLGKRAVVGDVVAAASAKAGNTGDATIAMGNPAVTSKVKDGRYIGIATDATHVRWEDPSGKAIGSSTHGAAFAKGGISLTITAGSTPNVAGDEFYVDVAADSGDFEFGVHDPSATDGFEVATAIALYPAKTEADGTAQISAITRLAEVNGNILGWDADITDSQKADAIQALADRGVIVR